MLVGTYAMSAGDVDACAVMALSFERANRHRRRGGPASPPSVAFPFGEKTADPISMYLRHTNPVPGTSPVTVA